MAFKCGDTLPITQPEFPCESKGVTYDRILIFKKSDRHKMPAGTVITNLHYTDLDIDTHQGQFEFEVEETGQRGVVPINAPQWFQLKHIKESLRDCIGVIT